MFNRWNLGYLFLQNPCQYVIWVLFICSWNVFSVFGDGFSYIKIRLNHLSQKSCKRLPKIYLFLNAPTGGILRKKISKLSYLQAYSQATLVLNHAKLSYIQEKIQLQAQK